MTREPVRHVAAKFGFALDSRITRHHIQLALCVVKAIGPDIRSRGKFFMVGEELMKNLFISVVVATCLSVGIAHAADKAALVEEGKALMQKYGGTLKAELQSAIKAAGAPQLFESCNTRAPEIGAEASAASGWSVTRSSHKLRNPANAPDAYTAAVIDEFLARQDAGEKAADMVKAEIVEENGKSVFRMVKAIPTAEVCLACHGGDQVKQPVLDRLTSLYPQDQARFFNVGEMRGVFTLSKPLD